MIKWAWSILVIGFLFMFVYSLIPLLSANDESQESESELEPETMADAKEDEEKMNLDEFTVLSNEQADEEAAALESQQMDQELNDERTGIVPDSLQIPTLDIDAEIEPVGVLDNGQMGVPQNEDGIAWFEPGTSPGETGNAVMAGHVDSRTGPAVFFDLDQLKAGDEITVTDEEGEALTFVVQKSESYDRDNAPIDEIFGAAEGSNLNLITCSGTFDQGEGTHEERLVVYTELKEDEEPLPDPPSAPTNVEMNGLTVTWHAVRSDEIVGYRVYRSEGDEDFKQVQSVNTHERKSFTGKGESDARYYITAVDQHGQESHASSQVAYTD